LPNPALLVARRDERNKFPVGLEARETAAADAARPVKPLNARGSGGLPRTAAPTSARVGRAERGI